MFWKAFLGPLRVNLLKVELSTRAPMLAAAEHKEPNFSRAAAFELCPAFTPAGSSNGSSHCSHLDDLALHDCGEASQHPSPNAGLNGRPLPGSLGNRAQAVELRFLRDRTHTLDKNCISI